MPFIDDIYLKNLLSTSLQNFRNELITHKVSKINCNFIDFIINKSPTNISYLNEYYKYFNQIDINIIKNTRNAQDELLIDYYRNINTENMDLDTLNHISFFLKTYEITNNIIDLFSDNFILNNHSINQSSDNLNDTYDVNEKEFISIIRCDINKNKQDIMDIQMQVETMQNQVKNMRNQIETMKNEINAKINKLFLFLNPSFLQDTVIQN